MAFGDFGQNDVHEDDRDDDYDDDRDGVRDDDRDGDRGVCDDVMAKKIKALLEIRPSTISYYYFKRLAD